MSRLERKTYTELTDDQRGVFDDIVANRPVRPVDGHIGGPFDIWLRSPELGKRLVGLGGFFRFRTTVARRYVEVVILTTGAHWQAQFEWWAHEPMAREAGVPDGVIASIRTRATPNFDDDGDRAAWQLANELHETRTLSAATFESAKVQFGETGVAELIGLAGFYTLVSMTLNAFDVELPPGANYPFARA
jgi:4-carboxymuconolactone decarboxylase